MNKKRYQKIAGYIIFSGIIMIFSAFAILIYSRVYSRNASRKIIQVNKKIHAVMPEITSGIWQEQSDMRMQSAEIDGTDFIGLLEIPVCNMEFPVCNSCDNKNVRIFPCRYTGSIYDESLIIGDISINGQFSFMNQLPYGTEILFTDMDGYQYHYSVCDIIHADSLEADKIRFNQYDLTIFFRNRIFSDEYTVVGADYC